MHRNSDAILLAAFTYGKHRHSPTLPPLSMEWIRHTESTPSGCFNFDLDANHAASASPWTQSPRSRCRQSKAIREALNDQRPRQFDIPAFDLDLRPKSKSAGPNSMT
jgi:hypothetical protein